MSWTNYLDILMNKVIQIIGPFEHIVLNLIKEGGREFGEEVKVKQDDCEDIFLDRLLAKINYLQRYQTVVGLYYLYLFQSCLLDYLDPKIGSDNWDSGFDKSGTYLEWEWEWGNVCVGPRWE